jgi:hypothetical protein
MHEALRCAPITFASRGIHSATFGRSANNRFAESGNGVGSVLKTKKENNMIKKLLGVAALAAVCAVAPAEAAHMGVGCNGASFAKTESAIETMADGEHKMAAQKEIAAAQDAMLNGKGGNCAAHLSKAMHDTAMK